jgi:hypothetical protein
LSPVRLASVGVLAWLFCASTALAEASPHWSFGVERLFGVGHSWGAADTGDESQATTSVSLGLAYLDHRGYGTPRIGADYISDLGLSFGTAFGVATYRRENEDTEIRDSYWLFAPRLGWFVPMHPNLALWPRSGLTLVTSGQEPPGDHAAFTLELPLVWRIADGAIGFSATPHLELGYSPGNDAFFGLVSTTGTVSEIGLTFGANLMF